LADPDMSIQSDVPRFAKMGDVMMPVDGVIIATPTHLHASHGIEAAERGWHMLIEKPVAEKLESAKKLETALRSKNIRSLVGHHRRYHAVVQQLKACLQDGLIGEVVNVSVLWAMRKPDVYFEGNWRTDDGSPVMINLVHDIDTRVESGAIALAFENGAVGTISFADTTPSPWGFEAGTGENPNIGTTKQDMMWITGTKGAISFPSMTVWEGTDWGTSAKPVAFEPAQNTRTPLEAQLDHFVDVINGDEPLIDVTDAASTLAIAQELENQLAAPTSNKATKSARIGLAKFGAIKYDSAT
jgi:predicted dehydrogenase